MPNKYIWYLPFDASDLRKAAKEYREHSSKKADHSGSIIIANGKAKKRLKGVDDPWTAIYVLIHGVTLAPLMSAGKKKMDVERLAELLADEDLPKPHIDLRLFACYSGLATRKDQPSPSKKELSVIKKEVKAALPIERDRVLLKHKFKLPETYTEAETQNIPLAAHLCSYMKHTHGYTRLVVTGYKGAITLGMGRFVSKDGYSHEFHKRVYGERASEAKIQFTGDSDTTDQRWG